MEGTLERDIQAFKLRRQRYFLRPIDAAELAARRDVGLPKFLGEPPRGLARYALPHLDGNARLQRTVLLLPAGLETNTETIIARFLLTELGDQPGVYQ